MARVGQGKGVRAIPVLTRGLSDQVWVKGGDCRFVDGCYFQVVGSVEKVRGVRNLVDWDWFTPHLLNSRINAMTSFKVRNGPDELVVSLSGTDSSKAASNDMLKLMTDDQTVDGNLLSVYRDGRVLVVRARRLAHEKLPYHAIGSHWEERFGYVERLRKRDKVIDARRVDPEDQYGGDYFAQWGGWLFITNGEDANVKYNGDYTSEVGVHETPAPPSCGRWASDRFSSQFSVPEESSTAEIPDRDTSGNPIYRFQYRATFVSSSGAEGPPSAPGNFSVTGRHLEAQTEDALGATVGSSGTDWNGNPFQTAQGHIPTPAGSEPGEFELRALVKISSMNRPRQPDLVWRNIYKRARDGEYYFWRQISVNETEAFDYEPPLESSEMGMPLNEGLQAPPLSKFSAFFRGRGYYVPTEFPSFVFYSDSGLPEQMSSALQYLDVNSDDGERVTGLFAFGDSLVVFKTSSIWQVTATADGSPVLTPVDESIGSSAPRASVLAYERLVFVGRQGVYQYDGAAVRPVSEDLNLWWRDVYKDGLHTATAWLDEEERRLFVSLQSGPDVLNDMVVCYHYQLDAITVVRGQRITASTRYGGETLLGVRLPEEELGIATFDVRPEEDPRPFEKRKNADIVIWGLGDSFTYNYNPDCGDPPSSGLGPPDLGTPSIGGSSSDLGLFDELDLCPVTVGSVAGMIRFGPYSSIQTGWNSGEEMEVSGIDVFFPYAGTQELILRWYRNRDPVAAGEITFRLDQSGTKSQKSGNVDLETKLGWNQKDWGDDTWSGRQQLFQRITFPETAVCREIEIEFQNSNEDEPFLLDGFVLWRVSKGSEKQR